MDPQTGSVIWAYRSSLYQRGPRPEDTTEHLATLKPGIFGPAAIRRLGTHLTRSADGERLNIDLVEGDRWHVGTFNLKTRALEPWQTFDRCVKHGQFSPVDPDLMLICEDHYGDILTGEHLPWQNRLWTIRRGERAQPVFADTERYNVKSQFHEWWLADGRIGFVDIDRGTQIYDPATRELTHVWDNGRCHSHCCTDASLFVGDMNVYHPKPERPMRIAFFNPGTGKEVSIVSDHPAPDRIQALGYHWHPHPQFILDDRFVAYTSNVRGHLDLALVPVDRLVEQTG